MSKSDKDHNHSNQNQPKKNIKIAFFINLIFSKANFSLAFFSIVCPLCPTQFMI